MARCTSRHPSHPAQVRCELPAGHLNESRPHFHSFYMRSWEDLEPRTWQERARAGRLVSKDMTGTVAA
jgi:hypothetical protein